MCCYELELFKIMEYDDKHGLKKTIKIDLFRGQFFYQRNLLMQPSWDQV